MNTWNSLRIGALTFLILIGLTGSGQAAPAGEKVFAMVAKVEGKGAAKLRRAIGTEAVVGSQMEVYPGDRIVTDDDSTVDLALADGTIIRVGINSEFHLQEAQLKNKFVSWVFGLVQGTIRTLAEKSADHSSVKVRVSSPSGTMGIRGTEVILGYDPKTGQTSLYTLEGDATFGTVNCEQSKSCVSVKTGTFSSVTTKATKATAPAKFQDKDLFGIPGVADSAKDAPFHQRLVLLQGVARANTALAAVMSEADVKKAIAEAQNNLQAQQDAMLNRTAEIRRAMHAAMAAGTYDQVLKIADNYDTSRGHGADAKDMSVINTGPAAVKRFALGLAIVDSPAFKDGGADGATKPSNDLKVLEKDSPILAKAEKWSDAAAKDPSSAPFVSINGEAKPDANAQQASAGQIDGKELRPLTATERGLLKDPAVQTAFNELAVTSQGIATSKNSECGALCALAKANTNPPQTQSTPQSRSRRGRRNRGASFESCERYVTVCTYKRVNGKREKVCNQVCKSSNGDNSSSPAN